MLPAVYLLVPDNESKGFRELGNQRFVDDFKGHVIV